MGPPKNDKGHLHRLVERRLGRPVNETVWRLLDRFGELNYYKGLSEAELVKEGHLGDVIELYRRYELVYRAGREAASPQDTERGLAEGQARDGGLAEGEAPGAMGARAEAFSRWVAAVARAEPGVVRYRQEVLGGRTLSEEEAYAFVESPVLAVAPWEYLKGLPCAPWEVEGKVWEEDGEVVLELERPVHRRWRGRPNWEVLSYPRQGRGEVVRVASQSVLGELQELATWLAQRYSWQDVQAVWFVLTDATPWVAPARWRLSTSMNPFFCRSVVRLEVEPWVPPARLMKAYRRLQHQLGITRGVGERASALVSFLADHVTVHDYNYRLGASSYLELPPWQRLMALWNEAHPSWRYQDLRRFARDCKAALERVVFKRELLARGLRLWAE